MQEVDVVWIFIEKGERCVSKGLMVMEVSGKQEDEDRSGSGWITSIMTCWRENSEGRNHKWRRPVRNRDRAS